MQLGHGFAGPFPDGDLGERGNSAYVVPQVDGQWCTMHACTQVSAFAACCFFSTRVFVLQDVCMVPVPPRLDADRSGTVSISELVAFVGEEPAVSQRTGKLS